jgi:hypothetical protein
MQLTMCHKLKFVLQTRQYTGNAQKFGRVLDVVSPPKFLADQQQRICFRNISMSFSDIIEVIGYSPPKI